MSTISPVRNTPIQETPVQPEAGLKLGLLRRFGFRLLFSYVFFYLWSLFVPGIWEPLVSWAGPHFFHTEVAQEFTGSGDTAYNWVMEACCAALTLMTALLWTLADPKRRADARLNEWMRVAVRFSLAMQMLVYGIMKVIPTQFSTPRLSALAEPLGDHSPMGLLWAFMGTSMVYTIFAGSVETLGGLLLLSRRTTLLGALVCIVAMGNVVALNFCFDVPVKLMSAHLLLLAVLLVAPDVGRLCSIFLLNRPALSVPLGSHSGRRWVNWTLRGIKILLFSVLINSNVQEDLSDRTMFAPTGPQSPLSGIWNADEPAQNSLPEADRWREVSIDSAGVFGLMTADGAFRRYRLSVSTAQGKLTLASVQPRVRVYRLTYTQTRPDQINIHGEFDAHPLQATLTRRPDSKPLLLSRGFHWISPVPFNR